MHPLSLPITIDELCSTWPWFIGSDISPWLSRLASQKLGILKKVLRAFNDRLFLGRRFRRILLPVLENCSVGWCSAADTSLNLQTLNYIAHHRYMAVLCMLYKIRCSPLHPIYCALSVQSEGLSEIQIYMRTVKKILIIMIKATGHASLKNFY